MSDTALTNQTRLESVIVVAKPTIKIRRIPMITINGENHPACTECFVKERFSAPRYNDDGPLASLEMIALLNNVAEIASKWRQSHDLDAIRQYCQNLETNACLAEMRKRERRIRQDGRAPGTKCWRSKVNRAVIRAIVEIKEVNTRPSNEVCLTLRVALTTLLELHCTKWGANLSQFIEKFAAQQ